MIKIKLSGEDYAILVAHFEQCALQMASGDIKTLIQAQMMEVVERFYGKSFWPNKVASIGLKPAQALALKLWLTKTAHPADPYTLSLVIALTDTVCKQLNLTLKTWMQN